MNTHYYGFDNWSDVIAQFNAPEMPEPELVYAVYSTPAYEVAADVVYRQDGKWFHNSGGHCSCYGLEDQWEPTELDPNVHLAAIVQGKRDLCVCDTEGDYPEATQENFDAWLKWAVSQS